jgi:cobalt/nickel transport system permease protein
MNKESFILINVFLYSIIVAFSSLQFIFLIPLFIVLYLEKENFFEIIKKLFFLNFFIVVLVIFVYFQNKNSAIELFFRTNLILLFNLAIFYKSKGYDIVRALDALKFPSKIVSVFYFTLSLIEYLMMDFKKTKDSLKARGFNGNISIFSYQIYGNIFAMIFIKALKKSEDMKYSMNARGFEDRIYFLNSQNIGLSQKILFASIIVILIKVAYELFR